MPVEFIIADDHPVVTIGVARLIAAHPDLSLRGCARNSSELVNLLATTSVQVAVIDYSMPGGEYGDGLSLIRFLLRRFPRMALVLLTGNDSSHIIEHAQRAGVKCIVAKSDPLEYLPPAILAAAVGRSHLSPRMLELASLHEQLPGVVLSGRELEVLRLLVEGYSQREVARQLCRSVQTISAQKRSAMKKLGLNSTIDVHRYAAANGWVTCADGG
ncbi:DNA-binding response regulator [Stenotrophomonas maltophilia]|uniref:response regulator transcription factor n=1 Tax=Stenotrophomonas maltophilia TaxID=40324 RepID=UPI0015DD7F73|nr:response regulator transcription factor [Stenotrophomonas maltophilia]MBA0220140.1 DNA-binding response regulator [Stenotrophomonas maltophilia]